MADKTDPEYSGQVTILVCGRTGVGKSTLINEIFGANICPTGGPDEESEKASDDVDVDEFEHVTREVTATCKSLNGVLLTIYDSPGLQDGTGNDDKYLQDIRNYYDSVDLVLYCIDFTSDRWLEQENRAIALFSEEFGSSFWEKTIVVFTKANRVQNDLRRRAGYESKLEKRFESYAKKTRNNLTLNKISPDITKGLPFVAAGHKETRKLVYVSERLKVQPYGANYLAELWVMCVDRFKLRGSSSLAAFMQATYVGGRYALDPTVVAEFEKAMVTDEERYGIPLNETSERDDAPREDIPLERRKAVAREAKNKQDAAEAKDCADTELEKLRGQTALDVMQNIKDLDAGMEIKKWVDTEIEKLKTQIDQEMEEKIHNQGVVEAMTWKNIAMDKLKVQVQQKLKEQEKIEVKCWAINELKHLKSRVAQEVEKKIARQDAAAKMNEWVHTETVSLQANMPGNIEASEVKTWVSTAIDKLREKIALKMMLQIKEQDMEKVKRWVDTELHDLKQKTEHEVKQKIKGKGAAEVMNTASIAIEHLKRDIDLEMEQIIHDKSGLDGMDWARTKMDKLRLSIEQDVKVQEKLEVMNWANTELEELNRRVVEEVKQKINGEAAVEMNNWAGTEINNIKANITQMVEVMQEQVVVMTAIQQLTEQGRQKMMLKIREFEVAEMKRWVITALEKLKQKTELEVRQKIKEGAAETLRKSDIAIEEVKEKIMRDLDQTKHVQELRKSVDTAIVELRTQIEQNVEVKFQAEKAAEVLSFVNCKCDALKKKMAEYVLMIKGEEVEIVKKVVDSDIKQRNTQIEQEGRLKVKDEDVVAVTSWVDQQFVELEHILSEKVRCHKEMQDVREEERKKIADAEERLAQKRQEIMMQNMKLHKSYISHELKQLKTQIESEVSKITTQEAVNVVKWTNTKIEILRPILEKNVEDKLKTEDRTISKWIDNEIESLKSEVTPKVQKVKIAYDIKMWVCTKMVELKTQMTTKVVQLIKGKEEVAKMKDWIIEEIAKSEKITANKVMEEIIAGEESEKQKSWASGKLDLLTIELETKVTDKKEMQDKEMEELKRSAVGKIDDLKVLIAQAKQEIEKAVVITWSDMQELEKTIASEVIERKAMDMGIMCCTHWVDGEINKTKKQIKDVLKEQEKVEAKEWMRSKISAIKVSIQQARKKNETEEVIKWEESKIQELEKMITEEFVEREVIEKGKNLCNRSVESKISKTEDHIKARRKISQLKVTVQQAKQVLDGEQMEYVKQVEGNIKEKECTIVECGVTEQILLLCNQWVEMETTKMSKQINVTLVKKSMQNNIDLLKETVQILKQDKHIAASDITWAEQEIRKVEQARDIKVTEDAIIRKGELECYQEAEVEINAMVVPIAEKLKVAMQNSMQEKIKVVKVHMKQHGIKGREVENKIKEIDKVLALPLPEQKIEVYQQAYMQTIKLLTEVHNMPRVEEVKMTDTSTVLLDREQTIATLQATSSIWGNFKTWLGALKTKFLSWFGHGQQSRT